MGSALEMAVVLWPTETAGRAALERMKKRHSRSSEPCTFRVTTSSNIRCSVFCNGKQEGKETGFIVDAGLEILRSYQQMRMKKSLNHLKSAQHEMRCSV